MKFIFYKTTAEKLAVLILLILFTGSTLLVIGRGYIEWRNNRITFFDFAIIILLFLILLILTYYLFLYKFLIIERRIVFNDKHIIIGKKLKIKYCDVMGWKYNMSDVSNVVIVTILYTSNNKIKKFSFYINKKTDLQSFKKFMREKGIRYISKI